MKRDGTRVVMKVVFCICMWIIVASQYLGAQTPKNTLPGRAPMHSHLLKPSDAWNAYYDVAPEDQRVLFWTVKTLTQIAREQAQQIAALEKRLAKIEESVKALPTEPNLPQPTRETVQTKEN